VFLHGFPGSRYAGALIDDAARGAGVRVIAPERPGIGLSSPQPGRSLLDYAHDLEQVADRLDLGDLALVAESGGGVVLSGYSPEELAATVRGLLADGDRLAEMRRRGREYVAREHAPSRLRELLAEAFAAEEAGR
jgi:pimeloyl-ACP methyl ester carboxylesterase